MVKKLIVKSLLALGVFAFLALPAAALPCECHLQCPFQADFVACTCVRYLGAPVTTCGEWRAGGCGDLFLAESKDEEMVFLGDQGICSEGGGPTLALEEPANVEPRETPQVDVRTDLLAAPEALEPGAEER